MNVETFKQASWLGLASAAVRTRSVRLVPCRRTRIKLDGAFTGSGRLIAGIQWPDNFHDETHIVVRKGAELNVTGHFRVFSGGRIGLAPGARLLLGSGYINNDCRINCISRIEIGRDVAIGPRFCARDDDGHEVDGSRRPASIVIGDHVWMGMNVTVLKGVNIGAGAVIAAGSIVTKDVPPGWIAAGVPARPLRETSWT
jgi:acetyltransferase-like isoleucine patch superfamily enzyme